MNSVSALLVVGGMFLLWAVAGVIGEVRAKLARRAADWLIPDGQAWTVRIAFVLAAVARWIAPQTKVGYEARSAEVVWLASTWTAPEDALAELAADLQAAERVIDPVRLVLPLLHVAIKARVLWTLATLAYVAVVMAFLPIVVSGEIYGWIRERVARPERHTDVD